MLHEFLKRLNSGKEPISLDLKRLSIAKAQQLENARSNLLEQLNFSEIPPPDPPLTPILLAARWVSHDLYNEDMPAIAADLLEAGYETPALIRLAGETQIYASFDVQRLIGKVFEELGVSWPLSEVQAKLITTRQIAREVIAGSRDPFRAASELEIVLWNCSPVTEDLGFLFMLNDELSWDSENQRYLPEILQDGLKTFARLANLTDEQIEHEAKSRK